MLLTKAARPQWRKQINVSFSYAELYQKTFAIENGKMRRDGVIAWSFHLADSFYLIPALHFAENFAALPA